MTTRHPVFAGLSSLRGRIFLATAVLALLSIATAILLVNVRVTREAQDRVQREIVTAGALADDLVATRTKTFTEMARFVADAPTIKAAVDTDDPPTVQDVVDGYRTYVESGLLVLTNKGGRVLAAVGTSNEAAAHIAGQPAIAEAAAGREQMTLLPESNGILELVTVPIAIGVKEPQVLGTLSAGFVLGEPFAAELKAITGSDVAFALGPQVLASTLPRTMVPLLTARQPAAAPVDAIVGGEQYAVLTRQLSALKSQTPDIKPLALILRSRADDLRSLRSIHTGLAIIAVFAVALATVLSFAVARTITRPLADITDTMRQVAATGDLTRKIAVGRSGWTDEDAQLLAATFNTLTDSVARFQREASQRERLSSLGRMSTVVAHEVRNPLMIIKAALHALRRPDVSAASLAETVADIDGEVERLDRIVNDVLDFSRPIRFDLGPVDVGALCRDAAARAEALPGPRVAVEVRPGLPLLNTDADRLRIALVNVLENARHASAASDSVRFSAGVANGVVRLTVADRGAGIAAADLRHIFDPYFTTKRGGTGLGLPITKNIIEGLGGSITVSSAVSTGTEFQIELPIPAETAASAAVSVS